MLLSNDVTARNRAVAFRSTPLGRASGDVTRIVARIGDSPDAPVREFSGRCAWMLNELVKAGARGVTTLEMPAPRVSHYIFRLRRDGVAIETRRENHSGAYSGNHGRFILAVPVAVLEIERAGANDA